MDPLSALAVCAAALCVGLAVGATGIGGVLLIPALWLLAGVPVREAMGTVLAANAANGALAAFLFARRGSIDWRIAAPLAAGALVFAFAGGTLNAYLPAAALVKLLGVVMAAGCAYAYFAPAPRLTAGPARGRTALLFAIGLVSGLAAGLTGAGGPLVSVPLMTAAAFPFLATVGASQVLQLAASVSGAAAYGRDGAIAASLLALIVPVQLAGIWAGVRLAHRLDVRLARRAIAALGVVVGGLLVGI
ncbi:MAG TPA: sulfite exporter TauE/SafE family protein [Burkholderiales bacterium]|jgi:hypothetical protein|nr:sulfite exporter TauE/SafE family protein [Burkholderiales bacterium]